MRWYFVLMIVFAAAVVVMAGIWVKMSYGSFPNTIMPGATYTVGERTYKAPLLPHKTYGRAHQEPRLDRPVPMLDEQVLVDLRKLSVDAFDSLRDADIEFWCTGGTLISAVLWKHFMPYDDDIDCATHFKNAPYLYGPEFAKLLKTRGLESFFLRGCSEASATREGAAVRIRRRGTIFPTMDIFFVDQMEDGTWSRVSTWSDGGKHRTWAVPQEHWLDTDWLFPIREVEVDGMTWPIGNQPEKMLTQQYGDKWSTYIQSPEPLIKTHSFAFWVSDKANAWWSHDV